MENAVIWTMSGLATIALVWCFFWLAYLSTSQKPENIAYLEVIRQKRRNALTWRHDNRGHH